MEEWRDVPGYEGIYEVSNFGRVRRLGGTAGARSKPRILRPGTMRHGHKNVCLCVNARPTMFRVHALVLLAFVGGPPSPLHVVAHNDGNPGNNRLENLRWATRAENSFDQVLHGTQKGRHHGRPSALSDEQIVAIRADHRAEHLVAADYGIAPGTVGQIRRRQTHAHIPPRPGDYAPKKSHLDFTDDAIRRIRADTRAPSAIAQDYRCSPTTIRAIQTRQSYAHVPDVPEVVEAPTPAPTADAIREARVRVVGSVGFVGLSRGKTAIFDAADVDKVTGHLWQASKGKNTHYAATRIRHPDGRVSTLFLHRAIMTPPEGFVVDHINGDGLDNRRSNLRVATVAQNNLNSRVRRDSRSGLKGAHYDAKTGSHYARIKVDGRYIHLGTFATAEEAANAYAEASAKYHGPYGRTHMDG